jgi:YggT family protein
MLIMFALIVHWLFLVYTVMIFIRILASWIPEFNNSTFVRFIAFYVDPYLNIFRKIIPPIGGVLDISPILAFFALQLAEYLLLSLF